MKLVEFGEQNDNIVLLLHGGGLSWWNFRAVAESLQDQYHVVLPLLDGHANSDRDFTSIEDHAKELIDLISQKWNGTVFLLGGLSLGGQIVAEMLSQKADICRYAVIESALVKPMKLTHALMAPSIAASYGLIKKLWFSKIQFSSLRMPNALFEAYYRDSCQITKSNMIAFLGANTAYTLKDSICHTTAKVCIMVGGKEQRQMIQSAKLLHTKIENSKLIVFKDWYHGEASMKYPQIYIQALEQMIQSKE